MRILLSPHAGRGPRRPRHRRGEAAAEGEGARPKEPRPESPPHPRPDGLTSPPGKGRTTSSPRPRGEGNRLFQIGTCLMPARPEGRRAFPSPRTRGEGRDDPIVGAARRQPRVRARGRRRHTRRYPLTLALTGSRRLPARGGRRPLPAHGERGTSLFQIGTCPMPAWPEGRRAFPLPARGERAATTPSSARRGGSRG